MSPKRGDRAAPTPVDDEWDIRFSTNEAIKGWAQLEQQARENLRRAWDTMRTNPGPGPGKPNPRHGQLKGSLATGRQSGRVLPLWQLEVSSSARIWYLLDEETHRTWVHHAGVGHPKATDS